MSLEAEFDEDIASEMDEMLGRMIDIVDDNGSAKAVTANVGEFMETREFSDRNHNLKIVSAAPVVILKETNPEFGKFLREHKQAVIPNGWTCAFDGREFVVTSSASDEVSWSFAIQQSGAS